MISLSASRGDGNGHWDRDHGDFIGQHEDRALARAVGFLAMLRDVEAESLGLLVGAERHDQAEHLEDDEGHDAGIDEGRAGAERLLAELRRVAGEEAISATPFLRGKDSGEQRASEAADTVAGEDVERIIQARARAEQDHEVAGEGGDSAQGQRTERAHEAGGGGDGHETDDDAGRGAHGGDVSGAHGVEDRPDHQRRHRRQEGVGERQCRRSVRGERAAAVEAEPAEPEQPGAQQHEGDVVRQDRLAPIVLAGAQHRRGDERRHAGVDVHDGATGEVEHAQGTEPATTPDPVGDGGVHQEQPHRDEHDVGPEAHALHHRTRDQGRRDDGEGALIGHEQQVRNGALGRQVDTVQERVAESAEPRRARGEREAVGHERPQDPDKPEGHVAHHHGVERILRPDQATVEERQGWRHEEHQRGRHENPGGVGRHEGWNGILQREEKVWTGHSETASMREGTGQRADLGK